MENPSTHYRDAYAALAAHSRLCPLCLPGCHHAGRDLIIPLSGSALCAEGMRLRRPLLPYATPNGLAFMPSSPQVDE